MYGLGARRVAVLIALVLGYSPSARTIARGLHRECVVEYNQEAELFNAKLSSEIDYLNINLLQANMVFVDLYTPFLLLIQKPVKYAQGKINLPENLTFPAIFAFGDSIVDTGNNNYVVTFAKCNFPPYGRDFQGGKASGRFSNGKVPADLLVDALGIKPLLPPYLDPYLTSEDLPTGVNFASGGAGYDILTSTLVQAIPLEKQLEMFSEYKEKLKRAVGEERAKTIITNGGYLVSVVSNDIANTYFHTPFRIPEYDVSAYSDFLVNSAAFFLERLYGLGARRVFVLNAPPLGCIPSMRTLAGGLERNCYEGYNKMSGLFNSKISTELQRINSEFMQAKMVILDVYTLLLDIIENAEKYGFGVIDKGCCGTGIIEVSYFCTEPNLFTCENASSYVFWDSYHPTERAYSIIVQRTLQDLVNQFSCNDVPC